MKDNRYFYMEDIDCVVTVEYASRKELLELLDNHIDNVRTYNEMIANGNPNACYYENNDDVFEILYKDGTTDYINDEYDGHKIRRQNIASIVYCNSSTYMVYGNFEMNENGVASPAFEDAIDESLKEVDSEDYTESAPEQTSEQEQQEEPGNQNNAVSKYTDEMLVEIYKNLKTSAKILGFASASDSEMMTEIELEAIKRHINLPDGAVEPQKEEISKQANAETDTYEHAIEMAMYAAECGDGVQAIYHKDGKFKAGLLADRTYATQNGWQYFHTVWETVPEEERMKQQKQDKINGARKKSLFWSRRLSYKSADSHPEWREKYKSAKQELERAKAELNKEELIMNTNTTTVNAFEIEFKANNPEEQKYLGMIQKVERMGTIRYRFTIADNFCMDMVICEHDLNDKNDLMNLWYKHGYVKERTLTHMGLDCYYTDFENGCYGRYNPTIVKSKLNFEWVLPYTPENLGKLLAEAIKRYDDDSDMFVVDVNGSLTYANSVISKGESPEEAVEEAFAKAHEDAERYAEYKKRYPENAEYWQKQIDECKNADYRAMRSSDFSRIQRQKFLRQPLHEVTAEDYEEMLDVLPPIHYVEINGVSEFCMMEMFTGTFTNQYAHDKKTGKYYQKLVDVADRDTWIHKILERK